MKPNRIELSASFPPEGITRGWLVEVAVSDLAGAALDCAYEMARCSNCRDLMLGPTGLLLALNDDANPPGWYLYAPRYKGRDDALAVIRNRFGDSVLVPIEATRIANPEYTVLTRSAA